MSNIKLGIRGTAIEAAANTYTIDTGRASSLEVGSLHTIQFPTANTGAATLNINGNGALSIVKRTATAIVSGDIQANQWVVLVYDGTNFIMSNVIPAPLNGTTIERYINFGSRNNNIGDHGTSSIGNNGTLYFSFDVPFDYGSLVAAEIVFISATTNAAANIDILLDWGAVGLAFNASSAQDLSSIYSVTTNIIGTINITSLLTGTPFISAGVTGGIQVVHNAVGGTIHYKGLRFRYTRA